MPAAEGRLRAGTGLARDRQQGDFPCAARRFSRSDRRRPRLSDGERPTRGGLAALVSGTSDALSSDDAPEGGLAMKLTRIGFGLILASLVAAGGGCATQPFVRSDPPAEAGGVSIALVDQQCDRRNDPSWSYADILGLDMRLRVTNSSGAELRFDPRMVRLLAAGQARAPHGADAAATIPPGGSRLFAVHFLERDDTLACNVSMALATDGAATLGSARLPLPALSFLASKSDT
jgi:hypothetical protein